jgi:hypothetical protein
MSWLFSRALMEEYLGENFSDGEQSAPLSGSHTQQAYCAPDKMMGFSRLSRFGMMYKPLTEDLGEELLMLYLEGFHAKTSQPQEKVSELTENDLECGEKWRGSFTKYDLDSCSWKTHQCSLLGDLDEFSETWPRWGLMRDGECWEQQTLAHLIKETEFGLSEKLPTPTATDYKNQPTSKSWKAKGAINYKLSNPEIQAKWTIPTPTARDGSGVRGKAAQERKGNPIDTVPIYVQKFPTPQSNDAKNAVVRHRTKSQQVMLGGTIATDNPELIGGQLNPTWVEWLMGWPLEWTDLKPLATDKFQQWQQQHGES